MISSRLALIAFILGCCAGLLHSPALAAGAWSPPESLQSLPAISDLPDAFTFADGTKVKSREDWGRRREELKAMLLYYEYGHMPLRPDRVIMVQSEQRPHESGLGTVESMTLEIDSVKKLQFRAVFYLPKHQGRRRMLWRQNSVGRLRHKELRQFRLFILDHFVFSERRGRFSAQKVLRV